MRRVIPGLILSLALAVVTACTTDPTAELRDGTGKLLASPAALIIEEGSTEDVTVGAFDGQGNPLAETFVPSFNAAILGVVRDSTFLAEYDGANLITPSEAVGFRFHVTANTVGSTTLSVSAGGSTVTVPVKVVPTVFAVATLSTGAASLGDTVTLSVPAPYKLDPSASTLSIPAGIVDFAADSSSVRFQPGPNVGGNVGVDNVILPYIASVAGPFTLSSTGVLTTPGVANIPAVFSNGTPTVNEVVTVTAAGYKFLPNAGVTFAGSLATVTAVAADSNSVSFRVPKAGTGAASFTNVSLDFLPAVGFAAPSAGAITAAGVIEIPGTDALGTAPIIMIPGAGESSSLVDAPSGFGLDQSGTFGAGGTRAYKFTVTSTRTFDITATWNNTVDLGIYLENGSTGAILSTATFPPADAGGTGAGGQPETTTWTVPPGTYILGVVWFRYGGVLVPPTAVTVVLDGP